MNNYPICWIQYLNITLDKNFSLDLRTEDIKDILDINIYNEIKDEYRNSDYKANLVFNPYTKVLADNFISNGYKIMVCTARPFNNPKFENLKTNTINWLNKNNFNFDIFLDKNVDLERLGLYEEIFFHIDDEYKYAQQFASHKVQTFLVGKHIIKKDNYINNVKNIEEIANIWMKYV